MFYYDSVLHIKRSDAVWERKRETQERTFESEIRRSLKSSKHIWWFRIQDTNDVNRFIKQAVAEKQPADFFSVYRGRPIMVEAKQVGTLLLSLFIMVVAVLSLASDR